MNSSNIFICRRFTKRGSSLLYKTIPPELGKLPALRFLGLAQNALSGFIPDSLFDLDVLEYLFLSYQYGNNWICLSSDGSVVDVQYAQGNSLNGVNLGLQGNMLGDGIARMTYLRTLSIDYNQFSGVSGFFTFRLLSLVVASCVSLTNPSDYITSNIQFGTTWYDVLSIYFEFACCCN